MVIRLVPTLVFAAIQFDVSLSSSHFLIHFRNHWNKQTRVREKRSINLTAGQFWGESGTALMVPWAGCGAHSQCDNKACLLRPCCTRSGRLEAFVFISTAWYKQITGTLYQTFHTSQVTGRGVKSTKNNSLFESSWFEHTLHFTGSCQFSPQLKL